jgi:hypothetical protein
MSEAYIQKNYKVLEAQYRFVREKTAHLNDDTRHFVSHVLVSTIQRLNRRAESLSSPISSTLIKKELRNARVFDAAELLNISHHSTAQGLCREFDAKPFWLQGYADCATALSAEQYLRAEKVNLFTGKHMRAVAKNRLYDDQRHYQPPLVIEAIKVICGSGCMFNLDGIEQHLARMRLLRDRCADEIGINSTQYARANGRYLNDFFCSRAILDQNPTATGVPGIYEYTPAYFVASTGRIQQYKGGLQSCSRRMKQVAYSGVPGLRNYDLKSSQLYALLLELIDADCDPLWLVRYLDTRDAKQVYAEMARMSVDCWKQCILALVMGATLPRATNEASIRHYSIMQTLLEEAEGDLELADGLRMNLTRVVGPLVEQINRWHSYLAGEFIERGTRQSKKGAYVMNHAGKRLYLSGLLSPRGRLRQKAKSKLAAFILQGREAAFIHSLTILGPEYGFKPISNEHDGLVVIGEIPAVAIRKAAESSGFENAELVEKPFI